LWLRGHLDFVRRPGRIETYGTSPRDLAVLGVAALVLTAGSVLASVVPASARRAPTRSPPCAPTNRDETNSGAQLGPCAERIDDASLCTIRHPRLDLLRRNNAARQQWSLS